MTNIIVEKDTWFIAHNGVDVFHTGFSEKNTSIDTGQPILEQYYTEIEYQVALGVLGITLETNENPIIE
jgi:hypothetical protein